LNEAAEEPKLVMWYCYALLGPAIWAFLNHLDKYLLGRFFEADAEGPVLALFTGFAGVIVEMAIPLLGAPVFTLAPWRAIAVMGAGMLLVASYIPYLIAMRRDEASIVASLYRLTPLFVFVLSYAVLGERLELKQIIGGFVTILGSISLIIDPRRRGNTLSLTTFALMCAACCMSAGSVVIFKFIALKASFWSSAFWEFVGAGLFSAILIGGIRSYRRALLTLLWSRDAYLLVPITFSGEALNLLANLAVGFASLVAPLALVSIVTSSHPIFLLLYGILFTLFVPSFGRERITRRDISRKAAAICVMCVGIVITFT
jgi:drug/metabolite transporter (DMT)-like permease